jgi:hypothetical protein
MNHHLMMCYQHLLPAEIMTLMVVDILKLEQYSSLQRCYFDFPNVDLTAVAFLYQETEGRKTNRGLPAVVAETVAEIGVVVAFSLLLLRH